MHTCSFDVGAGKYSPHLGSGPTGHEPGGGQCDSALILTGLRREEILLSRHEHLDLENGSLFPPKTKNGRSRHVGLNYAAIEVFKSAPRMDDSPWIFPGKYPMKPLNKRATILGDSGLFFFAAVIVQCCHAIGAYGANY